MVDFRRWITALAVIALFVGLASAQVSGPGVAGPLVCTATVAVPPTLRAEGITDLIGDIVITCGGGNNSGIAAGGAVPTANFTVSLGTNVTSRIIGSNNISEALLLVDEPNSGLTPPVAGFGPGAAITPCLVGGSLTTVGAGVGGCQSFFGTAANGLPVATGTSGGTTPGANAFFGVVNGNQVTFNGIPILAPVSAGTTRVFRITNVRANISGLGGGGLPGTSQLLASVSISGNTSLAVNNPVLIAGFIQTGLSTSFRNANNTGSLSSNGAVFPQCNTLNSPSGVSIIQFNENFGTAFKTRVAPTTTTAGSGQIIPTTQNVPGTNYNSESGLILPNVFSTTTGGVSFSGVQPGLADFGTRLKAVFNNVPAGVRIFVSVTNVTGNTSNSTTITAPAGTATSSYAQLVVSETAPEGSFVNPTTGVNGSPSTLALYELPVTGGTATAVWEVINTNPAALESFAFAVFTQFSANVANNLPAPGTGTVNLSFAPTSTATGATGGPIPRFADTSTARNIVGINLCQTLLLFPFVTNQAGFDTGLAIANTSTDPIGTGAQSGTCSLTWYDGTGKTAAYTTPNVASGTVWVDLVSVRAAGFQGYMFALCNFQFAHGFAFISDLGARNLAMGYLAHVVSSPAVRSNAPSSESLGQ